jgi:hypothetical protein
MYLLFSKEGLLNKSKAHSTIMGNCPPDKGGEIFLEFEVNFINPP